MPTPQNGQIYSNNSSATACLSVLDHFVGLVLKGLKGFDYLMAKSRIVEAK